jgi:predicted nucleic acid-binding protein
MIAVDTNILVYRFDYEESHKRSIAKRLIRDLRIGGDTVLLWQVLGDLIRQLHYWRHHGLLNATDVGRLVTAVRRTYPLVMPVEASVDRAMSYAVTHSLSHWDSMLVAACAESGVDTLYTEDMGAPRTIDRVQLINPFAAA